ncbi:hypothetical protein [Gordonia polyisoprenivorans]|uniref:hypothetical protein n=1 Tax=Gordonia polyisoprenivorans TaxID=84595 RepID=UPI001FCA83C4|nr:hypothetical protein [Gordonia polyisoprenivorans]
MLLGGKGAYDIKKAQSELAAAREQYEARRAASEALVASVNDRIVEYGREQESAIRDVALRMHDFLLRNEKKVRDNEKLLVDGIEAHVHLISSSGSMDLSMTEWIRGVIGSVGVGVGTSVATTSAVSAFGAASTGAAIAGLSGAAAESATLAWLGGGAVAAGGGGMALGAVALNFIAIGPGVLAAGFVVKGQGKKAITQALAFKAEIGIEIENLNIADTKMRAVNDRTEELSQILDEMKSKATTAMDELEAEPFDPLQHAPLFQRAMILVKGVIDIASTPVIDEEGSLTDAGHDLTVKFRTADNSSLRKTQRASGSPDESATESAEPSSDRVDDGELTHD